MLASLGNNIQKRGMILKKLVSFWKGSSDETRSAIVILAVSLAILLGAISALFIYVHQIKASGAALPTGLFAESNYLLYLAQRAPL